MATSKKVPVSRRAVIARLRRKLLSQDGEILRATRGMQAFLDLGEFYTFDARRNYVCRKHLQIEELARELGVLEPHEVLSK